VRRATIADGGPLDAGEVAILRVSASAGGAPAAAI
jgi:hypothetical protein